MTKIIISTGEYIDWLKVSGYSNRNDWNFQEIGEFSYYFIKNTKTGKYALIKHNFADDYYEVMVQDWVDYNGWDV